MSKKTVLDQAYALRSADDLRALYREWAQSYDIGFSDAQGYRLPHEVALAFAGAGGACPVLDVGAGTGLVADHLAQMGVHIVDALDLSEEMLAVARNKAMYRDYYTADVTGPLALANAPYAGIVSAGTFTLGHVGPKGIEQLLPLAAPGCQWVISVNAAHFEKAGFAALLDRLKPQIKSLKLRDVRIYDDRADDAHRRDMARLIMFRTP